MKDRVRGLVIITCILAASQAHSLGLGRVDASSYLGQPLRAQIDIIADAEDYGPDDVRVRQLNERQAHDLGIDLIGFNSGFRLQPRSESGRLVIDLTSRDSVTEPFLNILIELKWPAGTVYREYTLLLDPLRSGATIAPKTTTTKPSAIKPKQSVRKRAAVSTPDLRPGSNSYKVRSGDSLSRIASKVRQGSKVSRSEMMQWLLDHNPRAFIGGKMDKLLAGAELRLPENIESDVARSPASQAVVQPEQSTKAPASEAAPLNSTTQRLSIVTPNAGSAGINGSNSPNDALTLLQNQVVETTEVIESLRRENQVMRERLKQLEESEYVASLEQLVQLKELEMTVLRQQLQEKNQPSEGTDNQAVDQPVIPDPVEAGVGKQWWLILLLIVSLIGAAFFFLRWRSQSNVEKEAQPDELSDNELLQKLEGISLSGNYSGAPVTAPSAPNNKTVNLGTPRSQRDDDAVKRSIVEKTRSYLPPEQSALTSSEHDDIDDLISRAITMAHMDAFDQAEAILAAERTQQARIVTGDSGDIDARLEAAMRYIEQLRPL